MEGNKYTYIGLQILMDRDSYTMLCERQVGFQYDSDWDCSLEAAWRFLLEDYSLLLLQWSLSVTQKQQLCFKLSGEIA